MGRAANMQRQHDTRTEAALYWTAVSLIVCEGLSMKKPPNGSASMPKT
jgi:hypothetical protein